LGVTEELLRIEESAPIESRPCNEQLTGNVIEGILSALPCGVAIVDRDFRIIAANPTYVEPLGLGSSEVRGRHCHEVFSRHSNPCSMSGESCPIDAARATGTMGRVHREHRLPDGRIRNLEYTANPLLDKNGSISAFVVIVNDLTNVCEAEGHREQAKVAREDLNTAIQRHQVELEEKARRLEQANLELVRLSRAKSEFIAAVSQELRTPLAAIAEGVGLVEDGSFGAMNPDQQTFLSLADKNTRRLADLLDDLLDLSRIEAGRIEVHRRRLDLFKITREVATSYDSIARENHQTLKVDLPKGLEPVLADEQSVSRILNNLVSNAVKFTPSGGSITIAADRAAKRDPASVTRDPSDDGRRTTDDDQITISVSDTGIGIPADQQARLLGRPEPAQSPAAARPRGAGLGLALIRKLVEMNGGRLELTSDEGKGSCFSFTLPVYSEFAGLAADLAYFASTVADSRNGAPVVYYFRVQAGKDSSVLPQLGELLDSMFPKPVVLSTISSGSGLLVFAPRKLPVPELQPILESLKVVSLEAEGQNPKSRVRLQFATLDYGQLRLKLQSLITDHQEPFAEPSIRNPKSRIKNPEWWDAFFDELKPELKEIR
jgi:PAS domain S-box-containing protein